MTIVLYPVDTKSTESNMQNMISVGILQRRKKKPLLINLSVKTSMTRNGITWSTPQYDI